MMGPLFVTSDNGLVRSQYALNKIARFLLVPDRFAWRSSRGQVQDSLRDQVLVGVDDRPSVPLDANGLCSGNYCGGGPTARSRSANLFDVE